MTGWREALRRVTDTYLAPLSSHGFADAGAVYDRLRTLLPTNR